MQKATEKNTLKGMNNKNSNQPGSEGDSLENVSASSFCIRCFGSLSIKEETGWKMLSVWFMASKMEQVPSPLQTPSGGIVI